MTKIIFPTDEHFPFQDEKARSVALQIAADFKPDVRISGSDGIDFYSISKYDKDPARVKSVGIQFEIDQWKAGQREWIDACPDANAFFIVGNHEDRLRRWIWQHPEISDLEVLRLQSILGLPSLGVYWETEKGLSANLELVVHGRLVIKHGDIIRKNSAYTANAELEKEAFSTSVLTGHTHRGGTTFRRTRHGIVQATECFCLCDLNPQYVVRPNWQQGMVIATVTPESESIEAIPFHKQGSKTFAVWREKYYENN